MCWEEHTDFLERTFSFSTFLHAFLFMTEVAALAQKMNHYPHWENSVHLVKIKLFTRGDQQSLTTEDRKMAEEIDKIYNTSRK